MPSITFRPIGRLKNCSRLDVEERQIFLDGTGGKFEASRDEMCRHVLFGKIDDTFAFHHSAISQVG
jgi:hypothetical protein